MNIIRLSIILFLCLLAGNGYAQSFVQDLSRSDSVIVDKKYRFLQVQLNKTMVRTNGGGIKYNVTYQLSAKEDDAISTIKRYEDEDGELVLFTNEVSAIEFITNLGLEIVFISPNAFSEGAIKILFRQEII